MATLLDDEEIERRLPNGWELTGDSIARTFEFDDYLAGVAFAVDVGEVAESQFHHPTIEIGYKEVTVTFTTHDEGGVTDKDIELAELSNDEF